MADEETTPVPVAPEAAGMEPKVETPEIIETSKIEIVSPVLLVTCYFCTKEDIRKCRQCSRPFCIDHSHRFSPDFCQDCFKNITVIADKFVRSTEEYDHQSDTLITRRESCNRLRLDGPDYPFLTMWIDKLTEEETMSVYEFHYFIVKLIEHDNEIKKIGKLKKLRETPILHTKTTETRVRKEAKPKDVAAELKKLGLPQAVIDAMVAASKGGA